MSFSSKKQVCRTSLVSDVDIQLNALHEALSAYWRVISFFSNRFRRRRQAASSGVECSPKTGCLVPGHRSLMSNACEVPSSNQGFTMRLRQLAKRVGLRRPCVEGATTGPLPTLATEIIRGRARSIRLAAPLPSPQLDPIGSRSRSTVPSPRATGSTEGCSSPVFVPSAQGQRTHQELRLVGSGNDCPARLLVEWAVRDG